MLTKHSQINQLRLEMHQYNLKHPDAVICWRYKLCDSVNISEWTNKWYEQLRMGMYAKLEWVEVKITSHEQRQYLLKAVKHFQEVIETDNSSYLILFGHV